MSDPATREETVFNVARQLSHPQDRTAYLDDACGDDNALRERVERLLRAEWHANEFLANDPLGRDKTPCAGAEGAATSPSMTPVAPAPGDVIEDYEIIEKIGGNMGLVFKARHRLLDKIVALKLLPADAIIDPARLARFQRELRVMGQLEHANLVTAADARIVGHWHMVAMEFINGADLQRLVETQGALSIANACEVIRQAALALQYTHEHGLIHRDIKPSNLMLTQGGAVKVIDMGLAVIQEESTAQLTQTGLVLGTMRYCAPEQFRDASRVDIRADIYSLGCTLFHLLTGKPPYSQRTTLAEVVQAHLHEPFPSLAETLPNAPADLETVLARMTAKDPNSRFATPGQVAAALSAFASGADLKRHPGVKTPKAIAERGGASGKVLERPRQSEKNAPSPAGAAATIVARRKRLVVGLVLLVILALIGGAFLTKTLGDRERAQGAAQQGAQQGASVVVLMDTTAARGVYDEDNRANGGNNAQELSKVLESLLPQSLVQEPIGAFWAREAHVIARRPGLVIAHRSCFFHPLNVMMGFGYPPFTNRSDHTRWQNLYDVGDDRLKKMISDVGRAIANTHFLIYSRGTDTNWMSRAYRDDWTKKIEDRFPELRGRIETMLIDGGTNGTFRNKETAEDMRDRVKRILRLPEKQN